MTGVSCHDARELLRQCSAGHAVPATSPGWTELLRLGAVAGSPDHPTLTPGGVQGLRELDLRSYRADAWPLQRVLAESQQVARVLDEASRSAELFLTDLGPITPPEALPYLRVVAVGLANRRTDPEELVERFRQVWGMVEVMGGDSRDRLLAAELLDATGASMTNVYAGMVTTSEQLRSFGAVQAVTSAAILHIDPHQTPDPPLDGWREARRSMPTDEMAALLAMISVDPEGRRRFETFRAELSKETGMGGQLAAALYLAAIRADPAEGIDRIRRTARLLSGETGRPLLLASLLTHGPALGGLSPEELVEWVHHGAAAAKRVELAATDAEFETLGVALVEGLPPDAFLEPAGRAEPPNAFADAVTLLALHAWAYRGLIDPSQTFDLAEP
jgi:hypothetical protein